ncbi:hypothetical protein Syun_023136 [Stephania yunnanensis]|uniref:Uncharacterized protein n=1 Tax=Stephania yunnanensis TaxID=152371 RepID=A0AAP0F8C4_9MAGN
MRDAKQGAAEGDQRQRQRGSVTTEEKEEIRVRECLIATRVRAGRLGYRPKPESVGLLQRLDDLLELVSLSICLLCCQNILKIFLIRMIEEPAAYGKLGLTNLSKLREECLREFQFVDAYRTIKQSNVN